MLNQYTASHSQIIITQIDQRTFRFKFLQSGQYTLCISQRYISVLDPAVSSGGASNPWITASVVVTVTDAVNNLSYAWNDPVFHRIAGDLYSFKFNCSSGWAVTVSSYKCTVQAISTLTSSDLSDLGFANETSLKITGVIPLQICELNKPVKSSEGCFGSPSNGVPDFYAAMYTVNVKFDLPITINIKNYLMKTGYTGVAIDGNREYDASPNNYSWTLPDYAAKAKIAANAPPSITYQAALAKGIRNGMISKCQKLPIGFSKYSITYSKRITSNDGVPGYVLIINKKLYIQLFEMTGWNFGPSPTTKDNKTFRDWGCGNSFIRVY